MAATDHYTQQIIALLQQNVPEPMKESFMAVLGTILGSMEGDHIDRIDVFNEVYKHLGDERRKATTR